MTISRKEHGPGDMSSEAVDGPSPRGAAERSAPRHSQRWAPKLGLAFGAALATLAVVSAAGEFAVRYRERHRMTVPGTMPLLYYRHNRLRHALVRNYDYFGWAHIGREGFRGRDVSLDKRPDVLRIMVVGSSTTFDPQVTNDSATWPARLEAWLNRLAPDRKVEVINAGVPGYYVIDDVIRLETELYQYRPDLIILYEGHNDLFTALQHAGGDSAERGDEPRTPNEMPVASPWEHWLSRHSLLYAKLKGRLGAMRFLARGQAVRRSRTRASEHAALARGVERFTRDVTVFLAVSRALGFRVVVPELVHVSGVGATEERDRQTRDEWRRAVPFAQPETVLLGYVRYNQVLHELAERNGAPWIPTAGFDLGGTRWYAPGDPIHFNDAGADRFAERMAHALVGAGLLAR